jgi:hypothetical protein
MLTWFAVVAIGLSQPTDEELMAWLPENAPHGFDITLDGSDRRFRGARRGFVQGEAAGGSHTYLLGAWLSLTEQERRVSRDPETLQLRLFEGGNPGTGLPRLLCGGSAARATG